MTTRKARRRSTSLSWGGKGCEARTKAGLVCKSPPITGTHLCFTHTPSLAADRAEANKRGGRSRAYGLGNPAVVATIEDVRAKLCGVLGRLEAMDSTPEVCRVMLTCLGELRSTLEVGQLGTRLSALEKLMAERSGVGEGDRAGGNVNALAQLAGRSGSGAEWT